MAQTTTTEQTALKGGGGFGCSKGEDTVETASNNVETETEEVTPPAEEAEAADCPAPVDPLDPKEEDSCDDRDSYASAKGLAWSQEITSLFGRPVDEACAAECPDDAAHTPWTLRIELAGTPYGEGKSYSFSFMKDEFKHKVRYLEVKRDAANGCFLDDVEPCWRTCDDECVPLKTAVKDEETLEKEAKELLVAYANDVCKIGLTVADLEGDDDEVGEKLKAAAEKATFKDILQCAQGILLTGTQVLSWVDTASSLGLIRDETGAAYTQDQLFDCVKKQILEGGDRPPPAPAPAAPSAPPPPVAAPAGP